jgi:hypothetical protein
VRVSGKHLDRLNGLRRRAQQWRGRIRRRLMIASARSGCNTAGPSIRQSFGTPSLPAHQTHRLGPCGRHAPTSSRSAAVATPWIAFVEEKSYGSAHKVEHENHCHRDRSVSRIEHRRPALSTTDMWDFHHGCGSAPHSCCRAMPSECPRDPGRALSGKYARGHPGP